MNISGMVKGLIMAVVGFLVVLSIFTGTWSEVDDAIDNAEANVDGAGGTIFGLLDLVFPIGIAVALILAALSFIGKRRFA